MATNKAVLWEEVWKRTPNTKHFHLADGTKQAVIFSSPVHFMDEAGMYANIDTALFDEADLDLLDEPVSVESKEVFKELKAKAKAEKKLQKLNRDNCDFRGLKVPFEAKIPRNWKRGYSIGKGKDKLTFKPVGASPSKGYVSDDKNNEIVYQDAWNDVDVALELTPSGIKETLTLKTDKAPTSFTFEIDGQLEDNFVSGELRIEPAWLEDARGERRDVAQTIRSDGNKKYLDLVADVSGLTYPVTVDPTVVLETPDKDSYVYSAMPTSNYRQSIQLSVGSSAGTDIYRAFIGFYGFPTNLSGAVVTSAIMRLNCHISNSSVPLTVHAKRVTSSWSDHSLTWDYKPTFTETDKASAYIAENGFYEWGITGIAQGWLTGAYPNHGIMLQGSTESTPNSAKHFTSKENTNYGAESWPRLTITYTTPPTAPTVTSPNGGETWNALHTIAWNQATDPDPLVTEQYKSPTASNSSVIIKKGPGNYNAIKHSFLSNTNLTCLKDITIGLGQTGGNDVTLKFDLWESNSSHDLVAFKATKNFTVSNKASITDTVFELNFAIRPGYVWYVLTIEIMTDVYYATIATVGNVYVRQGQTYKRYVDDSSWVLLAPWYLRMTMNFDSSYLAYEIQLSVDNGNTWNQYITSLTDYGAATYAYDFTHKPQSNLCKIRIRAFDGYTYGPWDESDGVFSIIHNLAPTAPTNLSPSSGVRDRAATIRLEWKHNDPNADVQAKFDLQYSVDGGSNWTTVTQTTINQYYDVPANTFTKGTILWKVRTYDQAGLSGPYSAQTSFMAGDKPPTPTVIEPAGIVAVARPTVQWSSVDQFSYQNQALDDTSSVLWDSGEVVSTNKAQTIGVDLPNGLVGMVRNRIKNADGLWSDWDTSAITVSYTPPAVPAIVAIAQTGYIEIAVTNPAPTGTEPNVSRNDVYRRKVGESSWIRIASGLSASGKYRDYATASGTAYEYYVRAHGDNGTFSDSVSVTASLTIRSIWLYDVADPEGTIRQFLFDTGRNQKWKPDVTLMGYAGRARPVAEFGEMDEFGVQANLKIRKGSGDMEALEALAYSKATVCFRDSRGRKVFGIIPGLNPADNVFGNSVSLQVEEIDYSEVV